MEIDVHDPRVLDRLADGELTEDEERAVIAQCAESPDGWRRCALAFLEAQCWKREIALLQQDQSNSTRCQARQPDRDRAKPNRWTWAIALAAVFLLAVGVGRFVPRPWSQNSPRPVAQGATATRAATKTLVQSVEPAGIDQVPLEDVASDQPIGNLTLVANAGQQISVPVYDWNPRLADKIMRQSQPLPTDLLRHLKRHEVRSYQSYVPVRLKDGRQIIVPVQELDIVPIEGTAY